MNRKLRILAVVCLSIFIASCNQESFDSAIQSTTEVEGLIKNASGEPMPGVNIIVNGTKTGSVSNLEGYYKISLPEGATTLDFSFIGFESQNITINNKSVIDVVLQEGGEIEDIPEGSYFKVTKAIVTKEGKRFFSGRVFTKQGETLSGVKVRIMYAKSAQEAITDANGQFNAELKDGAMIAYFEKDGYEPNIVSIKALMDDK
ncbi:MAG: carboxypeptidase-like regulatory domain-containing protein [Bacteroidota bacterium]